MSVAPIRKPKVVLVGSTGVGKTSLILRHSGNGFSSKISPTIGASFITSTVCVDGSTTLQMQVWDTAGQERFRAMAPMYYRNADAALLIYDITCEVSFRDVKGWADELSRNLASSLKQISLYVVGNKSDLSENREVDSETGEQFAHSIGATFFETSALSGAGVEQLFKTLASYLLNNLQNEALDSPWGDSGRHQPLSLTQQNNKSACC